MKTADGSCSVVSNEDLRILLVCAVRYALGRRTYMPSIVQEIIMVRHDDVLLPEDFKQFADDIQRPGANLGDECDADGWKRFAAWCRERG